MEERKRPIDVLRHRDPESDAAPVGCARDAASELARAVIRVGTARPAADPDRSVGPSCVNFRHDAGHQENKHQNSRHQNNRRQKMQSSPGQHN
jgi:hypothetical protein